MKYKTDLIVDIRLSALLLNTDREVIFVFVFNSNFFQDISLETLKLLSSPRRSVNKDDSNGNCYLGEVGPNSSRGEVTVAFVAWPLERRC